jgi:RNA polymerase sigma factor (sigma-70 family)
MIQDSELLQEYVRNNSESAFKELVDRYIGLVYSTALRHTGREQIAEDVAQAVFVIFARKSHRMKAGTIVAGWLYRATRLAAAHATRDEVRRVARERVAAELADVHRQPDEGADWDQGSPLLDDGLHQLRHKDRDAVLLRFYQQLSLAEVGSALGCTEEAARKRVDRGLERLRTFFKRRSALVSITTLATTMSTQAQRMPPGLAHSACAVAFGKGATASITILYLVKDTMKTMLWSKAPLAVGLAIPLVALMVGPIVLRGQPGLVDSDFTSRLPISNSGEITALALQTDGKILVAGSFACYPLIDGQEIPTVGLARLHQDGSVDASFHSFGDRGIAALAVQKDGKIFIGGNWQDTNATQHANLCRLNPDGTIDSSFDPGPGTDWRPAPSTVSSLVRTLALQADGSVLIGGDFRQIAGESHPALVRLDSNGNVDPTFTPPTRAGDQVQRILVQPSGKLIISAAFVDPLPPQVLASVVRLNSDGTVDPTFHQPTDVRSGVLALQSNGQIVVRLKPANFLDLSEPVRLVRLNPEGTVDPAFAATVSLTNVVKPYPQVSAIVSAPGGKTILIGKFNRVNGIEQNDLARLNPDGSLDTTFQNGAGFEPVGNLSVKIGPAVLQPDGKILFGGSFGKMNGTACESLARVQGDSPLRFFNFHLTADRAFQSSVSGGPGSGAYLETSPDLKNWTRLSGTRADPPGLDLNVVNAVGGPVFYRAVAE